MYDEPEVIARSAQELVGDLNPQQAEAVQYRGQALLIGAGAGGVEAGRSVSGTSGDQDRKSTRLNSSH